MVDAVAVAAAHRLVRGPVARFEALVERGAFVGELARAVGGKVVDLRDAVGALVLLRPDGGAAALAGGHDVEAQGEREEERGDGLHLGCRGFS